MLRATLFLLLAGWTSLSIGQDLLTSRRTSYFTYTYTLTATEAKTLYTKGLGEVNESYFHTLTDSFPTDSGYQDNLPYGHYLHVHAEDHELVLNLRSVNQLRLMPLDNKRDLAFVLYGPDGQLVTEASAKRKKKRVPFRQDMQSYRLSATNRGGLVTVTYKGVTDYFLIEKEWGRTRLGRFTRRVIYTPPIRWAWYTPYRFVRTGIRSITNGYAQGWVRKIGSLFSDNDYSYQNRFKGYIVTNQPKYRPGDTVKVKALLLNKKGKPLTQSLELRLQNRYGGDYVNKVLATVTPRRPGVYHHAFVLADSLGLKLDQNYALSFEKKEEKEMMEKLFYYEDYELQASTFSLRVTPKKVHTEGEFLRLFLRGQDDNDLNLLDARAEVQLLTKEVLDYRANKIFIPDTLWQHKQKLDAVGETALTVPDSIFPSVKMTYEVKVRFFTSDNESEEKTETLTYDYQPGRPSLTVEGDSLKAKYLVKGKSREKAGFLTAHDGNGYQMWKKPVALPLTIALEPLVNYYRLTTDEETIREDVMNHPLTAHWRTEDSVFIQVDNRKGLPLWYHLYYKNRKIASGQTDSLDLAFKAHGKKPYLLVLQYVWRGKAHSENFGIPYLKRSLTVELDHPERIYPGQEVEVGVTVKDREDQPVPKVGLTAYGLTAKFEDYSPPTVPNFERSPRYARTFREFAHKRLRRQPHQKLLKRHTWDKAQGLDSIAWFQFLYPEKGLYMTSMPLSDSSAQLAPFVVDSGRIVPVHLIYIDQVPVYYRHIDIPQPYAVRVDTGYHQVTLRTRSQSIKIDSVYFRSGEKLILSADVLRSHPMKTVKKKPAYLETHEVKTLARRMMWLKSTRNDDPATKYTYLRQGNRIFWPKEYGQRYGRVDYMIGPFRNDTLHFVMPDAFSASLKYEPYFEYDFAPGLVKMYERDMPTYLSITDESRHVPLYDQAIREAEILAQWEKAAFDMKYAGQMAYYTEYTTHGHGELAIDFADTVRQALFRQLLFKKSEPDFLRIYEGHLNSFHDLDAGEYEVLMFCKDTTFYLLQQLEIQIDGTNYYCFDSLIAQQPTAIEKRLFELSLGELDSLLKAGQAIKEAYHLTFPYAASESWGTITGTVVDAQGNGPLIGVQIMVKGIASGTYSDEDGRFRLKAPNNAVLQFKYLGMITQEVFVNNRRTIQVQMDEGNSFLAEVEIVANNKPLYSKTMGYSVSQQLAGKVAGVNIRGARSNATVYYIDGQKVRGTANLPQAAIYSMQKVFTGGTPAEFGDFEGDNFDSVTILSSEEAVALYGEEAANGAVIITTKRAAELSRLAAQRAAVDESAANADASSLRRNFKDYAFWQPDLLTDAQGEARFTVTFPDDVTKWRTFALAYGQKRSGQAESFIRSYKELMAQVATPRFLIEGDSAHVITKALNYGPDSQAVSLSFEVGDRLVETREARLKDAVIDTFVVSPTTLDSLTLTYRLKKADGYFDGEERQIPVYRKGVSETVGQFHALHSDTMMALTFDPEKGPVKLHARADVLDVMLEEIESLRNYPYDCNEQAASKLMALLLQQRIYQHLDKPFAHEKQVKKLINRLTRAQGEDGLWAWWPSGDGQFWITEHVLTALVAAEQAGYQVTYDKQGLTSRFLFELEGKVKKELLRSFRLMHHFDPEFARKKALPQLATDTSFSFYEHLQILQLCQLYGVPYSLDTLLSTQKQTILGNVYWGSPRTWIGNNAIQTTLLAHQLLTADSSHKALLTRINAYFLERRHQGSWRNTYESAQILNAILPALLEGREKDELLVLQFEGALSIKVVDFPFEAEISPDDTLWVSKGGSLPVYLSASQQFHNYTPAAVTKDFEVKTWFEDEKGESNQALVPGKKTTLRIKVIVRRASDYVMIEVPIPAGCTYSAKPKASRWNKEVHREYFRDHTSIFCQRLEEGTYEFSIPLLARYGGSYTLNPAKTEEMYFPVFFGRNEGRRVQVGE